MYWHIVLAVQRDEIGWDKDRLAHFSTAGSSAREIRRSIRDGFIFLCGPRGLLISWMSYAFGIRNEVDKKKSNVCTANILFLERLLYTEHTA